MGLRAPSGWAANAPAAKTQENGLTPKQQDMAGSMYPGANKPSEPKPQEETVGTSELGQETGAEKRAAPDKLAQKKQELENSGIQQAVQQASQKIGGFKYKLQEYVNQFLKEGPSAVGVQTAWNAQTGKYEVIDQKDALNPVLAEKQAQQAKIKNELSPYMQDTSGGKVPKSFADVIRGMEMGGSDAGTARLLQLSDALDRMKQSGLEGSQEAKALEAQINDLDQFGMMGALRNAKKDYEDIMGGAKYYGDTGKQGYSVMDLASLESDKIKNELENASISSSGLFSGDFESDLKRAFDKQSQAAKRSEGVSTAVDQQVKNAFDVMLKDTRSGMLDARKGIEDKLSGITNQLKAKFEGTPGFEMWGDMLSDSGTFLETILKAANDPNSGLAADERSQLLKYLGTAGGENGQMYMWLDELAKSGSFTVDGETITPTWEQKDYLYRLMNDTNMNPQEKSAAIKDVINKTMVKDPDSPINAKQTIDQYLKEALASTQGGEGDVTKFMGNIQKTMDTFMGSKTENFFMKSMMNKLGDNPEIAALAAELDALNKTKATGKGNGMSLSASISNAINNPNLKKSIMTRLKAIFDKLDPTVKASITADMKANLAPEMQTASSSLNSQVADSIKDADKVVAAKTEEIQKESARILNLIQENANVVDTAANNFYQTLGKAWNDSYKTGLPAAIANIGNQAWAKTMLQNGSLDSTGVRTIAASNLMDQMQELLRSAGIVMGSDAAMTTQQFFDLESGRIDLDGMKKHVAAMEKIITEYLGNPAKSDEVFRANFASTPQGQLILKDQASRDRTLKTAQKNLDDYRTKLANGVSTIKNMKQLLANGDQVVTSPDALITQLLGDTNANTKLNPELAGMLKEENGQYFLSFGDGKFVPVNNEIIMQLNDTLNGYNVKQGVGGDTLQRKYADVALDTNRVTPFAGFNYKPSKEEVARIDDKLRRFGMERDPQTGILRVKSGVTVGSELSKLIKEFAVYMNNPSKPIPLNEATMDAFAQGNGYSTYDKMVESETKKADTANKEAKGSVESQYDAAMREGYRPGISNIEGGESAPMKGEYDASRVA